jgi:hypothetical protein
VLSNEAKATAIVRCKIAAIQSDWHQAMGLCLEFGGHDINYSTLAVGSIDKSAFGAANQLCAVQLQFLVLDSYNFPTNSLLHL